MTIDNKLLKNIPMSLTPASKYKIIRTLFLMVLMIGVIVMLLITRAQQPGGLRALRWWEFADVFFLFMFVFCRFVSVLFTGRIPDAARKMNIASLACAALAAVFFVIDYIAFN